MKRLALSSLSRLSLAGVVAASLVVSLLAPGCTEQSHRGRIARVDQLTTRAVALNDAQRPTGWAAFERRSYLDGEGGVLSFRVLYPEDYDRTKHDYPVVLFLHGAGERGDDNEAQLIHGAKQFTDPANRTRFPAIVLFPQCPKGTSWAPLSRPAAMIDGRRDMNAPYPPLSAEPSKQIRLLKGLLDEIQRTERVDKRRIYVMGLSMGGMGTLDLIARYPDTFAAAVPICGGADVLSTKRFAHKVPVWLAHGNADPVVPVKWSRDVVTALDLQDAHPLYTEFEGVGHDSWTPMFDKAELLPWVFSKTKGHSTTMPASK